MGQEIGIFGIPMDYGQQKRGVDMAPSSVRYEGVVESIKRLGYSVEDYGDLNKQLTPRTVEENPRLRNYNEVLNFASQSALKTDEIVKSNRFPLIIGGDHSISIGTIAGISKHYSNLGVIWYDAHTDLNTEESSPTGNIHGMPLAINLGYGNHDLTNILNYAPKIKPENVVIIGARSVDAGEKAFIKKHNIKVYTMTDIDLLGMPKIIDATLDYLGKCDGVHLSLDLDALDPLYAPGVGTPVPGGVTYRESHLAMELLYDAGIITSAEFVEINPILDDRNKTSKLAVELICSLLGKKIL